ncbi:HAMP domain-containing sensor histidine kinase [Acidovorax sp. ACV01]|uniref:sensor histidine kinase n=1 Tax=Acidovorax sp. ACV01 TaxID=2769311 RepID=UPI0017840873|nr:HAMP domain-containing histidine kinase [Acidovorax sp. ACV01]
MSVHWRQWHPRGGSLQRLLLVWLLGPLWALVALITAAHVVQQVRHGAAAQDEALRTALAHWPEVLPGASDESPLGPAPAAWFRESRVDGERLAGSAALPRVPPTEAAQGQGSVHFYLAQVGDQLVRVAVTLHQPPAATGDGQGAGEPVVRQVARPLSERVPSVSRLLGGGAGLRTVYLLALAMTAVVVVLARTASGWLRHADVSLTQPGAGSPGHGYDGPSELAPAVQHFGELQQSQNRWIEEQRRFLADATHQLRTPMAVLRTQLQSAISGDMLVADALHQMLHTVDRASGLANQLLSLSKVEQLKRMGELPSVDLNAIAREAVMELAPLIAAKRLDFALEGPELSAPGDAALLGELMRNLLANAIHHTPAHGRLGVLLRNCTGRREVLVWDEGPGIDDAVRQRLFQPFSAGKGGVGLGLSICRQIAESMGAEVTLFNRLDGGQVIGVDAVVAWN